MQELKRVIIAGKTYPIKLDLNVLEKIQEEYGSVGDFEMDILGLKYLKNQNGEMQYNEDNKPMLRLGEPSIKAIRFAMPAMINEGLAIEAEECGKPYEPITEEWFARNCNVSYDYLSKIIHEEFRRCFEIKK